MSALKPFLTNIANAIREKKETNSPINARDFANEILSIEGGSAVTDTPLTITSNGTTESPEGVRYTPITVEVPKPTLNAPLISINVSNAVLNVSDYRNGNFTTEYLLYRNGVQVNTFTAKSINLTEYMTVNGDETIQVRCAESEFFNESELSNVVDWVISRDGTAGLTYSGKALIGFGSVPEGTEIVYVASIVNDKTINQLGNQFVTPRLEFMNNTTIILPDTITYADSYCAEDTTQNKNVTLVVGAGFASIYANTWRGVRNFTLDLRKAQQIVALNTGALPSNASYVDAIVVKDNEYDTYKTATNWSKFASKIIRATDYEAQGGAV